MKYEFQKAQAKKTEERDKNIVRYHNEHPDSSQEDIGRIFHITGGRVSQILLKDKARQKQAHQADIMERAYRIALENQNGVDSLVER